MRTLTASWISLVLCAVGGSAQTVDVSAYYLNLASAANDSPVGEAGVSDFQRVRLMGSSAVGSVSLDVAYEHTLLVRSADAGGTRSLVFVPEAGGNWLDLDWTADEGDHVSWRHRFDRLSLNVPLGGAAEVSVGRQVVSWASTLILTPADPFTPFDPADPFREYRAGVDAFRLQAYPGPFTELDFVLRPVSAIDGDRITALARAKTNWVGWDFGVWGGIVFDEPAAAVSFVGAVGAWAVRSEVAVRSEMDDVIVRGTLGVDRRFTVSGRDLYLVAEYQHDGFGADRSEDLLGVVTAGPSSPFARGELQVLGQDAAAIQVSYQVHPLWGVDLLTITSLVDGSALLSGGAGWSVGPNSSLRGGFFLGLGDDAFDLMSGLASEYGAQPAVGYVSLSHFF